MPSDLVTFMFDLTQSGWVSGPQGRDLQGYPESLRPAVASLSDLRGPPVGDRCPRPSFPTSLCLCPTKQQAWHGFPRQEPKAAPPPHLSLRSRPSRQQKRAKMGCARFQSQASLLARDLNPLGAAPASAAQWVGVPSAAPKTCGSNSRPGCILRVWVTACTGGKLMI